MMKHKQKSYYAKPQSTERNWVIIDAAGQTLGHLAAKVAKIMRGKDKPVFTPSVDTGDFVIVINAEKIQVTGNKATQKIYYRHSNYPGGLKEESYEALMKRDPVRVIEHAVHGMLPHNRLGRAIRSKLKVYVGTEHPHAAQSPKEVTL